MKKSIFLLACLIGMASCSKKEDLFDKTHVQEESKENFPTQDIDPDHDWNMAAVKSLTVFMNDSPDEVYSIKVYRGNPLNENSDAKLMAKKENVKSGETITLKFDIPDAMKYVYVVREDKIYNRSMKRVDMTQDNPTASWKSSTQRSKSVYYMSRANDNYVYEKPDDSIFPTGIPNGVKDYPQDYGDCEDNGSYYIKGREVSLHWKTGVKLYVDGEVSISNIPDGTQIYLLPNSKLKKSIALPAGGLLSIGENASVKFETVSGTGSIYNRGIMEAESIGGGWGTFYIYNSGKLNVAKNVNLTNSSSIVNLGVLKVVGDIHLNSDSKIINEFDASLETGSFSEITNRSIVANLGQCHVSKTVTLNTDSQIINEEDATFTVDGIMTFNNKSAELLNEGIFRVNQIKADNGGCTIINKCALYVHSSMALGNSIIKLDGGAYLECASIDMYGTEITLNPKSLIYVTGTGITYGNNNSIIGEGNEDKGLLYVPNTIATQQGGGGQMVDYSGNLKIVYGSHFEEDDSYRYTIAESVENPEKENVKIGNINGCSRDYSTDEGDEEGKNDNVQIYTYAFEDITTEAGDYDFNDVVLKVKTVPVDGKLEVTLVAAGATKNLRVYYNNSLLFKGQEVHEAMGREPGEMINTGGVRGTEVIDKTIDWPERYSLKEQGNFYILDLKTNMTVKLPAFDDGFASGMVPYAILVPDDWDYPNEGQRVDEKYPDFVEWAEKANSNMNWYNPTR